MSSFIKKRILWINDDEDLSKVEPWIVSRARRITNSVILLHEETNAFSICFFDGDFEEGIIRCASADLADKAIDMLPAAIPQVENLGGKI